jgi:Response regulator receiver domain
MIRIVVADDHVVVRSGLEQLVSTFDDVQLVGTVANGAEAADVCIATRPDVALLDLEMPVADGIEATRRSGTVCRGNARDEKPGRCWGSRDGGPVARSGSASHPRGCDRWSLAQARPGSVPHGGAHRYGTPRGRGRARRCL